MTAPISILCLLLTAGTLLGLGSEQAQYRREGGRFTNSPNATYKVAFRLACSAKCTAMEPWFCGGFTYHDNGACELYSAATCVDPDEADPAPGVDHQSDTSSEPRSYRRLVHSTCPATTSSPCACPAGFSLCAGRCLALLNQPLTYADAAAACDQLGAHLAVPRSEAENQCAQDMAADVFAVYIGATDVAIEGTFVAADGLSGPVPANASWWAAYQPDNYGGNEHCALIHKGAWGDSPCSDKFDALCQLRDSYQPQCP